MRHGFSRRPGVAALGCLGLVVGALACGPTKRPPPGEPAREPEIILQTEAHDEKAGARAAEEITAQVGLVDDPVIASYVHHVGMRLARFAPATDFTSPGAIAPTSVRVTVVGV